MMIRVTIFNEFIHELRDEEVREVYPQGIHMALASFLGNELDIETVTATLRQEEHGLGADVLNNTDVLIWWGHLAHDEVTDEIAQRVQDRVLEGMGLIVLHSGHHSKVFKRLMGTSCSLLWREIGEKERLWVVNPSHPITQGLGAYVELPQTEMYGEFFDVPEPDELLFVSWFAGGEVFRSGMTWRRGRGRIFYFRPGHETFPMYHNAEIQKVLINGVRWAKFQGNREVLGIGDAINMKEPLELGAGLK
jgi:trehalose utilization protein